ncbi:TATA box-binding protein-associated factor RNA polymerase I subunit B isoform X2 [Anthonomus grandis grandis]|nr:TATA box-binding protein-associated factor RNA polymerase I subunit B isoform X2 [Anthonomus grandis grandis]
MSKKHRLEHNEDLYRDLSCHKLKTSNFKASFFMGPNNLTLFTLYSILYLAMLITGDSVQLGDFLRFIREGHVSFGCFRHFFDQDIDERSLNLPKRHERLFSHGFFRKRAAQLAHFLKVESYLVQPDLIALCERYCHELNLPKDIFQCCEKLITHVKPKLRFKRQGKILPNYEGRAISFILFVLKMLYGLDGKTEQNFSEYASLIRGSKIFFNFEHWLEYIQYRSHIVQIHHLPTNISFGKDFSSELYLSYLKNQNIQFKGSNRRIHGEVKDYLTILEKVLDTTEYEKHGEMVFEPSLIPFTNYVGKILEHQNVPCNDILLHDFQTESVEHILKPLKYLEAVNCMETKNGGANDDITVKELMYLYKGSILERKHSRKIVAVKITSKQKSDSHLEEYLSSTKNKTDVKREAGVLLSNWQQGNSKKFLQNKELLKIASCEVKLENYNQSLKQNYKKHYNPYERYWLNIFTNPLSYYLANKDAQVILKKLPYSFRVVFLECARIVEQDVATFYSEFLVTEMYLVYLAEFGKGRKERVKHAADFKKTLDCCMEYW